MRLQVAYIQWIDVVVDPVNGWKSEEDSDDFYDREDNVVEEVGFVYREDDDFICICGRYMPSDEIACTLTGARTKIPKKWILKRKELKI